MSAFILVPAPTGSVCQSLAHAEDDPVQVASVVASVMLTADVIAQVNLCHPCADMLVGATQTADYAGG